MRWLLKLAVGAVAVSIVLSVVVLLSLLGFNPLSLPNLGDAAAPGQQAAIVSAVAALSTAISTIFALVVGTIAILVLIQLSRVEETSVQQLKRDLLSIESALLALRNRSFLYQEGKLISPNLDPFEHEREQLAKLLASPTGYALYLWAETDGRGKYPDLFLDIGSLVNFLTLDLRAHFGRVAWEITVRSTAMVFELAKIDRSDRKMMAGYLSNLEASMRTVSEVANRDKVGKFVRERKETSEYEVPPPTEAELEWYKGEADRKIGGEASATVEHFGRAAIDGSAAERVNFQRLVDQLGLGEPPETI